MKQVLAILYGYPPENSRVIDPARSAVKDGYSVKVIGIAHYGGHSGYQQIDGVQITTVPVIFRLAHILPGISQLLRGTVPERPTSPGTLLPSNALSLLFFYLWTIRLALFQNLDLIHCHNHQAMPIAAFLSIIKRCAWIYDAHEHVPGNRQTFLTLKARLAVRVEALLLRHANAVITVGERLAQDLRQRGARKIVIIGNWKEKQRFQIPADELAAKRAEYDLDRFDLVISYFGVLNEERQTDVLISAAMERPQVGVLIAGRGDLQDFVAQTPQNYPNIIWLDWLPYEQVPLHTMLSDVVYACLKEVSGNPKYMTPNKLFDAGTAGKALIAHKGIGEIGAILEQVQAAVLLDDVTTETVCQAFDQLCDPDYLARLQANARTISETYNWDVAEARLHELYAELTGK